MLNLGDESSFFSRFQVQLGNELKNKVSLTPPRAGSENLAPLDRIRLIRDR